MKSEEVIYLDILKMKEIEHFIDTKILVLIRYSLKNNFQEYFVDIRPQVVLKGIKNPLNIFIWV